MVFRPSVSVSDSQQTDFEYVAKLQDENGMQYLSLGFSQAVCSRLLSLNGESLNLEDAYKSLLIKSVLTRLKVSNGSSDKWTWEILPHTPKNDSHWHFADVTFIEDKFVLGYKVETYADEESEGLKWSINDAPLSIEVDTDYRSTLHHGLAFFKMDRTDVSELQSKQLIEIPLLEESEIVFSRDWIKDQGSQRFESLFQPNQRGTTKCYIAIENDNHKISCAEAMEASPSKVSSLGLDGKTLLLVSDVGTAIRGKLVTFIKRNYFCVE